MFDWHITGLTPAISLDEAVSLFEKELPGWWWTMGNCNCSADASCAPTDEGIALLGTDIFTARDFDDRFDSGFHLDAPHPSHPASSLLAIMQQAIKAKLALAETLKNTSV